MDKDRNMLIFLIVSITLLAVGCYIRGRYDAKQNLEYYKEKSKKEQRLLWRISYTFPEQWELIKNTPEYYPCKQYNIENINEY